MTGMRRLLKSLCRGPCEITQHFTWFMSMKRHSFRIEIVAWIHVQFSHGYGLLYILNS